MRPSFMMPVRNIFNPPQQPIQQSRSLKPLQRRQMTRIDLSKPVSCGCGK